MNSYRHLAPYVAAAILLTGVYRTSFGEDVKVFLMAGHSNILGAAQAANLEPTWNVPQDDVTIWLDHNMDGMGDWVALEPGHGGPTHSSHPDDPEGITPGGDGHFKAGPELSIGRRLADAHPDHRIALIKHARGGGSIHTDWNPENIGPPESQDHPWSGLLKKTSDAFAALESEGTSYEVAGFFWGLGWRDTLNWNWRSTDPDEVEAGREASLARSAAYGEGLTNFIGAVRDEFGEDLPFVLARIPDSDDLTEHLLEVNPGFDLVRRAQIEVASADPWVTEFSTGGLSLRDTVHFDAAGQIEHGMRFANAYLDLVSVPEPTGGILGMSGMMLLLLRTRRKPNSHV